MNTWKTLITDAELLPLDRGLATMHDGAIASDEHGRIVWIGKTTDAVAHENCRESTRQIDGRGRLVTPGLIDCHTHLVYAGSRANEWQQRLAGVSYEEIARQGGGILSTVNSTRSAGLSELITSAVQRANQFLEFGVTTVEIKSGYGLNIETELKMLDAARAVEKETALDVSLTLLAAHAIPPEFKDGANSGAKQYLDEVVFPLIQHCQGKVDAVDVFCESIAFNLEQTKLVFEQAKTASLAIKIHAEQLSNLRGARLAAEYNAWSADHLEYLDEDGVKAMAQAGTVAVLLPGAFYFLNETQRPPVELLRNHGVPIAIATDHNPGSSPVFSLPLTMNMASTLFGLTVEESILGSTVHAARALRRDDDIGTLEVGKQFDVAVWNTAEPADLVYRIGDNLCCGVAKTGEFVIETT